MLYQGEKTAWIVQRDLDGAFRCDDKYGWQTKTNPENFIFYRTVHNAIKFGLRGAMRRSPGYDGTAYAIFPGDSVDCNGTITRG